MKKEILTSALALVINISLVLAQGKTFNISPDRPQQGQTINISYNPNGTVLDKKKEVELVMYLFWNLKWEKRELKMEKTDGIWQAAYKLPSNVAFTAYKFRSGRIIDNGGKKTYSWIIKESNGKNVMGALAGWAFLRNNSIPELFPDFADSDNMIGDDVASYWLGQELINDPSSRRMLFYPNLKILKKIDSVKAKTLARKDITYMKSLSDLDENELGEIRKVYAEILGRKDLADSMKSVISAIDSVAIKQRNPEKLALAKKMLTERDNMKLLTMTIDFINRFPMAKADQTFDRVNKIDYATYYRTLAILTFMNKDSVTFKKYVAEAPLASLSQIFYRCMQVPYVSLKTHTADQIYVYARPIMGRLLDFSSEKSSGFIENYENNAGVYADILMHLGKTEMALSYAKVAQNKYQFRNAPLNEIESLLLKKIGNTKELQQVLEGSMKKNQMTPTMLNLIKEEYVARNKSLDGYQEYLLSLKDIKLDAVLREKISKSMVNKDLPEFSVMNNKGKVVKLSELKGKTIVLDFWASWCAPCKAALPGMKMAVDKYKSDKNVVFLFVDTQEKRADYIEWVDQYLKENNFDFEVLFDADAKFSKSYGVGAIPHKMVIDRNGKLRFSQMGYMGSPSGLADEIGMMVELAKIAD